MTNTPHDLPNEEDELVLRFHFIKVYERREHLNDVGGFSIKALQHGSVEGGHAPSDKGRLTDVHERLVRDLKANGEAAKYLRAEYLAANPRDIKDIPQEIGGRW